HLNWPRVVATVPLEKDAMEGPFPLEDLALEDATGNNVGTVSAESPIGPKWCEIRQTIFNWTTQKFPFGVKTAHALKIREPHVITVTGKAFYDIGDGLRFIVESDELLTAFLEFESPLL